MVRMHGSQHKWNPGARVRLSANVDPSIYGDFAAIGNEGIVGQIRKDRFDLPEVYIQWDQNHWAYNGVQDCWTYPDHFELIEDSMSSKQDKVQDLLAMFAQGMSQLLGEDETGEKGQSEPQPAPSQPTGLRNKFLEAMQPLQQQKEDDEFTQAVEAASVKLGESEAFIIIGLEHRNHPGAPQGMLEPYAVGFSKSPEADIIVTAHMSRVAAKAHESLAMETVAQMVGE